eukprot:6464874-Amphidinium_carterae.1
MDCWYGTSWANSPHLASLRCLSSQNEKQLTSFTIMSHVKSTIYCMCANVSKLTKSVKMGTVGTLQIERRVLQKLHTSGDATAHQRDFRLSSLLMEDMPILPTAEEMAQCAFEIEQNMNTYESCEDVVMTER